MEIDYLSEQKKKKKKKKEKKRERNEYRIMQLITLFFCKSSITAQE